MGSNHLANFPILSFAADPFFFAAFYNDQHFHYGYHIYAAAVVAHFDPDWGRRFYERVLLLIRNIANPSEDDPHFPTWRHKDWYQGHSWASGIPQPPYPNGKNQESSSEAVAAYEAIALYGKVMVSVQDSFHKSSAQCYAAAYNGTQLISDFLSFLPSFRLVTGRKCHERG